MGNLMHEELSREVIGAAMDVLNALKPGLDEKFYENAGIVSNNRKEYRCTTKTAS